MSCFEIHDPAFGRFVLGNAPVKQLATGFDWVEVWFGDTGRMDQDDPANIRHFFMDSARPKSLGIFHTIAPGKADGIRCDVDGNLWSSAGDGVHCIAPDGHLMARFSCRKKSRISALAGAPSTSFISRPPPAYTPSP